MKVLAIYRPDGACVTPADSLQEAAGKMRASGLGCLPVVEGSQLTGIVTERDLAEAMANGLPPSEAYVVDYTSDDFVTVSLDDECEEAERKMLALGCRNLPVVDHDRLVGTVSMRDLVLENIATRIPQPLAAATDWPEEPPPDVDSEH